MSGMNVHPSQVDHLGTSGLIAIDLDDPITRLVKGLGRQESTRYGYYYSNTDGGNQSWMVILLPTTLDLPSGLASDLAGYFQHPLVRRIRVRRLRDESKNQESILHLSYRSLLSQVMTETLALTGQERMDSVIDYIFAYPHPRLHLQAMNHLIKHLERHPISNEYVAFDDLGPTLFMASVDLTLPTHPPSLIQETLVVALHEQHGYLQSLMQGMISRFVTDPKFLNHLSSGVSVGEALEALQESSTAHLNDLRRLLSTCNQGHLPLSLLRTMVGAANVEAQQVALLQGRTAPPLLSWEVNQFPSTINVDQDISTCRAPSRPPSRKTHEPRRKTHGKSTDLEHLSREQLLHLLRQLDETEMAGEGDISTCRQLRYEIAKQLSTH